MTRTALLSFLGVGLVGGVVGGLVGRISAPAAKPARAALSARAEGEAQGSNEDLERRVKELEGTVAALERQHKMGRLAAAYGSALAAAEDAGAPAGSVVDDPVFQAAVRDVMDQVEVEKRDERRVERDERRRQAAARWTSSLSKELGLSDAQKQKVAAIVEGYFDDLRAIRESDAGPGSPRDWRQSMQDARKKREDELAQALTPAQMEKYDSLESDQKLGAGFGGGRRFRGGN